MKRWKQKLLRKMEECIDGRMEVNALLFNVFTMCGIVSSFFAGLLTILVSFDAKAVLCIFSVGLILILIFAQTNHTKKYEKGGILVIAFVVLIMMPYLFFVCGGVHSGMSHWLALGMLFTFLLIEGRAFYVLISFEILENIFVFYVAYAMPELVIPLKSEVAFYLDVLQSLIFVTLIIGALFKAEQYIYLRAKQDAEKANMAKSDFLTNISHEIRTPINAILGMNEMVLRESSEKNVLEYSKTVKAAGDSLLSLVNDILDFSKAESGRTQLIEEEYQMDKMLNEILRMVRMRAEEKNLKIYVQMSPRFPRILLGDATKVKQIITNLVTNAIKYTDDGHIMLTVDVKDASNEECIMEVHVKDTGKGIKTEEKHLLFRDFQRLDEKKNRAIEGSGIGLALVKRFLDMLGGEIYVDSVYGKGSDFWFVLPQKIADPGFAGKFIEEEETYPEEKRESEHFIAPSAKLLVVDDNAMNLKVFRNLVKEICLQIDTALSGPEALECVKREHYDIIYLDHLMPEMDGIETLHKMKELRTHSNLETPVIVLTANAVVGARETYLEEGFTDYLSKPIEPSVLEQQIRKYLPDSYIMASKKEPPRMVSYGADGEMNLVDITEIRMQKALEYSASGIDGVKENMAMFAESAAENIAAMQTDLKNEDYENYTIHVHALKSTALLIGAEDLSERAKSLEMAGHNGEISYIRENAEELLKDYAALSEKIKEALANEGGAEAIESETVRSAATKEEIVTLLDSIIEDAESFDEEEVKNCLIKLDQMDYLLQYKKEMKNAIDRFDFEKMLELTQEMKKWG